MTHTYSNGQYEWNVERLWKLAKDLPVQLIPIEQLVHVLDEEGWVDPDQMTNRDVLEHCQRVTQASLEYPIILSSEGCVMDGIHRIAHAVLEGVSTIRAVQFEVDPEPDGPDTYTYRSHRSVSQIVSYLEEKIQHMITRPEMYGSPSQVEMVFYQAVETRNFILTGNGSFQEKISDFIHHKTGKNEPLSWQIEKEDILPFRKLSELLQEFLEYHKIKIGAKG